MKEFVNVMQCGFAAVGGFFGWFVGGLDGFIYALVVFVVAVVESVPIFALWAPLTRKIPLKSTFAAKR